MGLSMKLKVLKQFSHFRLGAFVSGEVVNVPDNYANHLIEIGVAEEIKEAQAVEEVVDNGNKRTRSRKS